VHLSQSVFQQLRRTWHLAETFCSEFLCLEFYLEALGRADSLLKNRLVWMFALGHFYIPWPRCHLVFFLTFKTVMNTLPRSSYLVSIILVMITAAILAKVSSMLNKQFNPHLGGCKLSAQICKAFRILSRLVDNYHYCNHSSMWFLLRLNPASSFLQSSANHIVLHFSCGRLSFREESITTTLTAVLSSGRFLRSLCCYQLPSPSIVSSVSPHLHLARDTGLLAHSHMAINWCFQDIRFPIGTRCLHQEIQ
jgi:hypothetical protein